MKKFETYRDAKKERDYSVAWAEMLGKQYHGGGGGIGKLVHMKLSTQEMSTPTIYYQHNNGDKNYHECPRALLPHLDAAICDAFPMLLANALAKFDESVKAAAVAALAERDELERAAA